MRMTLRFGYARIPSNTTRVGTERVKPYPSRKGEAHKTWHDCHDLPASHTIAFSSQYGAVVFGAGRSHLPSLFFRAGLLILTLLMTPFTYRNDANPTSRNSIEHESSWYWNQPVFRLVPDGNIDFVESNNIVVIVQASWGWASDTNYFNDDSRSPRGMIPIVQVVTLSKAIVRQNHSVFRLVPGGENIDFFHSNNIVIIFPAL